jgi:hypothetical protein
MISLRHSNYTHSVTLSIQGLASGKILKFNSNFHQSGGYGTCFSYGYSNVTLTTVQVGD